MLKSSSGWSGSYKKLARVVCAKTENNANVKLRGSLCDSLLQYTRVIFVLFKHKKYGGNLSRQVVFRLAIDRCFPVEISAGMRKTADCCKVRSFRTKSVVFSRKIRQNLQILFCNHEV